MAEHDLCFSPTSSINEGSFKLVELPSDLSKIVEDAILNEDNLRLKIKGQANDDAVLCTPNKTFSIRSVVLSNSILVVTPPPDASSADFSDNAVVIRDQISEIMELAPSVPKLHKLSTLLRGRTYDEDDDNDYVLDSQESETERFTYEDALSTIQASDAELDQGIKDRRILNINGELRPIAPPYLDRLLELILNVLISLSLSHEAASVEQLSSALANEHQVSRTVSIQVMSWFGSLKEGKWQIDIIALVRELGLSILRHYRHDPIHQDELISRWKSLVGDTFESHVDLSLLLGNYLASLNDAALLTYFPASSLPADAAPRFADLFLTRPRWKGPDISPFLADIAIDPKERDKLLLKFARTTTDAQGVWYTARSQYNG